MQAPRLLRTIAARQVARRYHQESQPPATYNDLPSPQGSWKTAYESAQRKHNAALAFGISFFTGTILFGNIAGLFELNWFPPEHPAEIESYRD